jgi:hypothetical protein
MGIPWGVHHGRIIASVVLRRRGRRPCVLLSRRPAHAIAAPAVALPAAAFRRTPAF